MAQPIHTCGRTLDGIKLQQYNGSDNGQYGAGSLTVDTWYRRQVTSTLNGNQCTELRIRRVTVNNLTPVHKRDTDYM